MKLELLLPCLLAYVSFGDLLASRSAYIADPDHLYIPLPGRLLQRRMAEVVTNHI